jgi:hypothetical protein
MNQANAGLCAAPPQTTRFYSALSDEVVGKTALETKEPLHIGDPTEFL